ncbi:MAG: hypothetical protein AAGA78_06150 [Pseudomonadota bacterium]
MPKLFRSVFLGATLFASSSLADARKDAEILADALFEAPAIADALEQVFITPGLNFFEEYLSEAGVEVSDPWPLILFIQQTYVSEMTEPVREAYINELTAQLSAETLRAAASFYSSKEGKSFLDIGMSLMGVMSDALEEQLTSKMEETDALLGTIVADRLSQGDEPSIATSEALLAFLRSHPPLNGGEYSEPVVQPETEVPGVRKLTPLPKE